MRTDAPLVAPDATVEAALSVLQSGQAAALLGTPDALIGLVTLEGMRRASESGHAAEPAGSFREEAVIHVHPDHPFDVVLERFAQSAGLLPVVGRDHARRVEGVITLDDVTRFIERRRAERRDDEASPPT